MDTSDADALFAQTLVGDYNGDGGWAAVNALREDASRDIYEQAAAWCLSDDPLRRARAVDILGQLRKAGAWSAAGGGPEWLFRDESYSVVTKMLEHEEDPMVLDAAISALGHLHDPDAIPLIVRYQNHPGKNVRFAVSFALGCFPNGAQSVHALLILTADADADVRDWAVFGLGVLGDADSPEIREALLRCLDDASEDVREEAAVGLGKRRDRRLIPKLRTMLDEPEISCRVAEATAALLGMDSDPPDWTAPDCRAALQSFLNDSAAPGVTPSEAS